MKILTTVLVILLITILAPAQKNKQVSLAFMNVSTANPFSKFASLATDIQHPGVELGYSFNWRTKARHDWYQEIKLAWFYHRFVQHAFPLYTDVGYRYKFSNRWNAKGALGAGYLHSIPATPQLKLESNGEYKNGKGIGRMQGLALINIGAAHIFNPSAKKPVTLFITWQQMLQTPFINSYVPLLPYNSLLAGINIPIKNKIN